jgi:uncharacterized protein YcbX
MTGGLAWAVARLTRYPVKSPAGENLEEAVVGRRGPAGDRSRAVHTDDGGSGAARPPRRFRRVDGLLQLAAILAAGISPGR